MLSLAIAFAALFVVIDSLCAYFDAREGTTGIYETREGFDHRRHTCIGCTKDTGGTP